ncbi:hypothetical protein [Comamonas thiooxydans]|uniref:hypothetical protein n=1 Tax=Comamonas thiooxydans TaxID=363952 RepID=UPI003D32CD53
MTDQTTVMAYLRTELGAGSCVGQAIFDFGEPIIEEGVAYGRLHQKNQSNGNYGYNERVFDDLRAFFILDKGLQGMAKLLSDAVHGDTSKLSQGLHAGAMARRQSHAFVRLWSSSAGCFAWRNASRLVLGE